MVPWIIVPIFTFVLATTACRDTTCGFFTILELDRHRLIRTLHQKPTQQHDSQSRGFRNGLLEKQGALGEAQEAQLCARIGREAGRERGSCLPDELHGADTSEMEDPRVVVARCSWGLGSGRERDRRLAHKK